MKIVACCLLVSVAAFAAEGQGTGGAAAASAEKVEAAPASQPASVHQITVKDIDGRSRSLGEYKGKVLLVVNVASKCGFTKQYDGLEKLYQAHKDQGLVVLGVPSNDFNQEPGSEADIKTFCATKYSVTFPMLSKVSVKDGPDQSELYDFLTHKSRNGVLNAKVAWNFNKFLVGRDGRVIRYFPSKVTPDDPQLVEAIEQALGTSAQK